MLISNIVTSLIFLWLWVIVGFIVFRGWLVARDLVTVVKRYNRRFRK